MVRSITLGLVGEGIGGSLTPAMQEQEGHASGLSLAYHRIDSRVAGFGVRDLPDLLSWAVTLGFAGLNVTHPFKQAVLPLLDELAPSAYDLGAVNTVVIRDGHTIGHNTDWTGFQRALQRELPETAADPVTVVGAGGAGVAVGYALLDRGAPLVRFCDLDPVRAEEVANRLAKRFCTDRVRAESDPAAALHESAGLVNASPTGMTGHPGLPVPADLIRPDLWISDVVYFPLETELVALGRRRGCRVVPGGGMAVFQAVGAFELFTGLAPDPDRMVRHFEELTGS